jgi:hypothetical protein
MMLARALESKFNELWDHGVSPWAYLNELIAAARATNESFSTHHLFELLGVPADRRKHFENKLQSQSDGFKMLQYATADRNDAGAGAQLSSSAGISANESEKKPNTPGDA